jgi:hypothetical protein
MQKVAKVNSAQFSYQDLNGDFKLNRELKLQDGKLYSRLMLNTIDKNVLMEKTVALSKLGSIKVNKINLPSMLPEATQFEVWLDGKKYFVQSVINQKEKKLIQTYDPPFKGKQEDVFVIPKTNVLCFQSQLVECVMRSEFIAQSIDKKAGSMSLYLIWDSYPYHNDLFGVDLISPFESAKFSFIEEVENEYKYALETQRDTYFYYFDKRGRFIKYFWIAQGLSMKRES